MKLFKRGIALVLSTALICSNYAGYTYADAKELNGDFLSKYQNDTKYFKTYDQFETNNSINKLEDNGNLFQTKKLIIEGKIDDDLLEKINDKDIFVTSDDKKVISFATINDTKKAYDYLSSCDEIDDVYGENIYSICEDEELTPEDFPRRDNLSWGSDYINSPAIVDYINENNLDSKEDIVVAVIDTGINLNHGMFDGRIANGYKSFVEKEPTIEDKEGHGTHVSGIVVNNTPNNVKILPIKALASNGKGSDLDISMAVEYAITMNAKVINMSLGGKSKWGDSLITDAIKKAEALGITVVVAAGNDGESADECIPSKIEYCITVSACDKNGKIADFSNYGNCIDVCAPGVSIYSADKKNKDEKHCYDFKSGTSMATPYVASAVSLLKILYPKYSEKQIDSFVKNHVSSYSASDNNYGVGIIDLNNYVSNNKCSDVTYNYRSGDYIGEISVELNTKMNGASIYYTTDNSNPSTTNGAKYTGPVKITKDTQFKAIAVKNGMIASNITKAEYRFSLCDFDNNFIVYDDTICGYKGIFSTLALKNKIQGKTIKKIGYAAFKESKCKIVTLSDDIEKLSDQAFESSELVDLKGGKVRYIGDRCFNGCNEFTNTSMNLNDCIYIGDKSFCSCNAVKKFYFPKCIHLGNLAFDGCYNADLIFVPKCKAYESIYPKIIDKNKEYDDEFEIGHIVTSNVDEDLYVYLEGYEIWGGKIKKGESIRVLDSEKLHVLYTDSFKKLNVNGKTKSFSSSSPYDMTLDINENSTISYAPSSSNISESYVKLDDEIKYCGQKLTPLKSLNVSGEIVDSKNYKVQYYDNIKSGIGKIEIQGIGNFTGSKEVYFYIDPLSINECTCTIKDYKYTGKQIKPSVLLKYKNYVINDYTIRSYGENIYADIKGGSVVVVGKGDLKGEKRYFFNIYLDLKNAEIKVKKHDFYADGKAKKLNIELLNGINLVEKEDYIVSYSNNVKAGKAKAIITGIGKYKGRIEIPFVIKDVVKKNGEYISKDIKKVTIKKAKYSNAKLYVKWNKIKGSSGYQILVCHNKKFKKNVKKIDIKKSGITSKKISSLNKKISLRLKKRKSVFVKIRTYVKSGNRKIYSNWSNKTKVKY